MRRVCLILLFLVLPLALEAQTFKVHGRVTDEKTGEPIPFAGVFFEGTTTGVLTDETGRYSLETSDSTVTVLVCQLMGYESRYVKLRRRPSSTVNFALRLTENRLSEVVVKADNKRIKRLLRNIDAHRQQNDPQYRRAYQCDMYNKMEIDIAHADALLSPGALNDDLSFIKSYVDTLSAPGKANLPVLLSETVARRYHTSEPRQDNEIIKANRISGVNPENNLLTQFTGTMHIKINFYDDFIKVFNLEFPSPIKANGLIYYNYYIVDSLQIDGRKTLVIRYHPKKSVSSPVFDGEMMLDEGDYALRSIKASIKQGEDINWLRSASAEAEYVRLPDSTWFYKSDYLEADFSLVMDESSRLVSLLGKRSLVYSNPTFDESINVDTGKGMVYVEPGTISQDESFWKSVRPAHLSEREEGIYDMVDQFQQTRTYNLWYKLIKTAAVGYYEIGKVALGPWYKLFSYNNFEGFRTQLGLRTSEHFSKKHRIGGYVAYGLRDETLKGGATYELMLSRFPTRKFSFQTTYDMLQLGKGQSEFTRGNLLASFTRGSERPCLRLNVQAGYEHEFNPNFTLAGEIAVRRYYANAMVPMVTVQGVALPSIATNDLHFKARFSKDETVNRGYFEKIPIYSYYPVVSVDLYGGVSGLRENDYGYFRPEVTLDWRLKLPPVGTSNIHVNAGAVIGEVPYPLLHMPESNNSFILDKMAFSCMDFFEFATDSWVTLMWRHSFEGLVLGRIPLIRELKLREEFTFKMVYGGLSDKNNALVSGSTAPLAFPEGMKSIGDVPYVEIGAGISNILKVARVDCYWRMTHREKADNCFAVNVGLELKF